MGGAAASQSEDMDSARTRFEVNFVIYYMSLTPLTNLLAPSFLHGIPHPQAEPCGLKPQVGPEALGADRSPLLAAFPTHPLFSSEAFILPGMSALVRGSEGWLEAVGQPSDLASPLEESER